MTEKLECLQIMDPRPVGWSWAALENCVQILDAQRIPINSKERENRKGNVPYYGATGQVGWIDDYLFDEELLLLGEDGGPFLEQSKNKAYIIRGKSWVNNHAHVLRAFSQMSSNSYLCHYLNNFNYSGYVNGTTRLKLNQAQMRNIPVPIAPLNEQKRIVSKLEQLFTKLDAGMEYLKKTQILLNQYRKSVLKYAFEGKLTEKWREKHEKDLIPLESDEEIFKKNGKLLPINQEFLLAIPNKWRLLRTGEICEGIVPGRYKPKNFNGKIPWVTIPDIDGLYVSTSRQNLGVTEKGAQEVGMKIMPPNTVLMSCIGQFGIVCITKNNVVPNQQFHGFICSDKIIPEYLAFCLMNLTYQMKRISTATTISYLNKSKCNSLILPVAPYSEQEIIVREIFTLTSIIDNVNKTILERLRQSRILRSAILKFAYEGKLVPQDPTDELPKTFLQIERTTGVRN